MNINEILTVHSFITWMLYLPVPKYLKSYAIYTPDIENFYFRIFKKQLSQILYKINYFLTVSNMQN